VPSARPLQALVRRPLMDQGEEPVALAAGSLAAFCDTLWLGRAFKEESWR
jgi:hypothetical protein